MDKRKPQLFLYETLQERAIAIPNNLDKVMVLSSYANGSRVLETCTLQFSDYEWNNEFLYIHSDVLKKRKQTAPKRYNPISRLLEPWITEPVITYIQSNRSAEIDNKKVWPFTKRTAQRRFDQYFGTISHAMRHNRATHLMVKFDYSIRDLANYFVLSPASLADWAMRYGHLERSHLEDKARKKINEEKVEN